MDNKFFDFEKAKVQTITLEQLERTHKENDVYNNPLKGIYHFQLLNEVINMCNEQHFNVEECTTYLRHITKTALSQELCYFRR